MNHVVEAVAAAQSGVIGCVILVPVVGVFVRERGIGGEAYRVVALQREHGVHLRHLISSLTSSSMYESVGGHFCPLSAKVQ